MHSYVVQAAAATEPITVDEAKGFAQIDGTNAEPPPSALTVALVSPAAAGNVDNGAHRYRATFVTAAGETEAGIVSEAVTVVDKTVNGKVRLTAIPLGGAAVTSRKIYRTVAAGSTYLLLATVADNTTTAYTDNIADSALGAGAPATNSTYDALITLLIASARAHAEQELGRWLVTQTIDAYLESFPCWDDQAIRLPPLQSVTEIVYVDSAGDQQTLATSAYQVDSTSKPARIVPAYGTSWPATREQLNAVRVRFVAGYGAAAAVPQCVKHWMAMRLRSLYNNRDELVPSNSGLLQIPRDYVDSLLDSERVYGLR